MNICVWSSHWAGLVDRVSSDYEGTGHLQDNTKVRVTIHGFHFKGFDRLRSRFLENSPLPFPSSSFSKALYVFDHHQRKIEGNQE